MAKKLPKARDVNLALQNIPQWLSGVKIPKQLINLFGINPSLMGGLTLDTLGQTKALSEGALLQVEMANKFFDYLKNICESHEEIENLRSEAVKLMYQTKTREDESIMSALLAGTQYEEHFLTWTHKLNEHQNLIKGQGKLDRDYLSQDFKNKLLIAADKGKRKKLESNHRVEKAKQQAIKTAKEETEQEKALAEARANLEKLLRK